MACCSHLNWNVDVIECLRVLWRMLRSPKFGIKELDKEMARLEGKKDDIKNQIDQMERVGKNPTNEVSQWLEAVETLEVEVTAIKQDFESMSCFSCYYCSINLRTAEKISEANKLTNRALDPIVIDPNMPQSSINKLEMEMTRLKCKRDDINNQIDQAEREGKIPTNEVSQWLREVETLEDQMLNIKQDFKSAAKKLDEANDLMNRASALDPIAKVERREHTVMNPISHRPPIGIDSYVKNVVGCIDGEEGKIIGIYGMGGIGKTTILNDIRRHYFKDSIFDRVIRVVASKDCQLKRLQMDIAKSLDLQTLQESDDEKTRGEKLFNYLKNKNCLLLLDDIWEDVDLQRLGMATEEGQQQQPLKVVVFTTRSEIVCEHMKAEKKIPVKFLNSDQAWQLFEQNSEGDVLSSDAGIKFVAHELVKECAGLPLALVTVARAMTGKKSWEAWKDALHQIKDKHEWTTIGIPKDSLVMYKVFKLSYDGLEDDSIRECLLCCALWPEDYEMDKFEELIPCWIGCGIIHEFNVINEAFHKGCSHLDALMAASLLEYSSMREYHEKNKYVKMHDVIRDMTLLMVSGLKGNERKWIVKTKTGLSHLPRQEQWQEAERASFMSNQITPLQEYEASTFPKLSMLILRDNIHLKTIPPSLLANLPRLTYLDIAGCGITRLPKEICSLTELQYLDLSNNPITRLPAKLGCLGKLEYLILRWSEILTVPKGTIAKLSMLRWLDIRRNPWSMVDLWLNELKCFKGRHQLSVGMDIDATSHNIERLNMLPNVSIWDLTIVGDTSELLDLNLGALPQWSDNLEGLTFNSVRVDKLMLTSGVGHESSLRSLTILNLFDLQLLKEISLNEGLCNLREINISECHMLKDVSWVMQLPCLRLLHIICCSEIKEIISDIGNSNSISSIQSLSLWDLPNLTRIESQPFHFPFLEYIHVVRCPEFTNLSLGAEISKSKLKEIRGDEIWWCNLEWDHESHKNSLTPRFIPI